MFTYSAKAPGKVSITISNDRGIPGAALLYTVQPPAATPAATADAVDLTVVEGREARYVIMQDAPARLAVFNAPSTFTFMVNGKNCGARQTAVRYQDWHSCGEAPAGSYNLVVHTKELAAGTYFFRVVSWQAGLRNSPSVSLTLTVKRK